jgi:hypothetical protein
MLLSIKFGILFAEIFPVTVTFNNWICTCPWRSNIFQLYSCNKSRSMEDNLSLEISLSGIKCVLYAFMLHLQQFIAILRFHLKIIFKLISQNSSCPFIWPHGATRLQLDWISRFFEHFSRKFIIKIGKE